MGFLENIQTAFLLGLTLAGFVSGMVGLVVTRNGQATAKAVTEEGENIKKTADALTAKVFELEVSISEKNAQIKQCFDKSEANAREYNAMISRQNDLIISQQTLQAKLLVDYQTALDRLDKSQELNQKLENKAESLEKDNGKLKKRVTELEDFANKSAEYEERISQLEDHNQTLTTQFNQQRAYDKGALQGALLAMREIGIKIESSGTESTVPPEIEKDKTPDEN